ncbi:MAG: hypothetical protein ACI8Z1_001001 [Candidatus Azotimanducaceae bacterium]|jgi:hypothetical protein
MFLLDMWTKSVIVRLLALALVATVGAISGTNQAYADDGFESASTAYRNKNYQQAHAEFLALAQSGDARSQTVLAIMYKYGESVPIDLSAAYDWYMKAAIQGYPPALYNVGMMLVNGQGVASNAEEAKQWLQKAVDAGYERAEDMVAKLNGKTITASPSDLPITWSKSWNLRLPNDIRFNQASVTTANLKVIRVQLGAMSNIDRAHSLWQRLHNDHQDLLHEHQPIYREVRSGVDSFYRVQIGPFENYQSANALCDALLVRSQQCLVMLTD